MQYQLRVSAVYHNLNEGKCSHIKYHAAGTRSYSPRPTYISLVLLHSLFHTRTLHSSTLRLEPHYFVVFPLRLLFQFLVCGSFTATFVARIINVMFNKACEWGSAFTIYTTNEHTHTHMHTPHDPNNVSVIIGNLFDLINIFDWIKSIYHENSRSHILVACGSLSLSVCVENSHLVKWFLRSLTSCIYRIWICVDVLKNSWWVREYDAFQCNNL